MRTYTVTVTIKADSPEDARIVATPEHDADLTHAGVEDYEVIRVSEAREVTG